MGKKVILIMFRGEEAAFSILTRALNEIENITSSAISPHKPISEPVLTPSHHLVDKEEVSKILNQNPDHKYLKNIQPWEDRIFFPVKMLIKLRNELRHKLKTIKNNSE